MSSEQIESAAERRHCLLAAMRRGGGTWDWRRARETYEPRPEPKSVRRDLQRLCRDGMLTRVQLGVYVVTAP